MKITDEMIEAASSAYALHPQNSESVALKEPIRAAIEAALRVRKARKAAKRKAAFKPCEIRHCQIGRITLKVRA